MGTTIKVEIFKLKSQKGCDFVYTVCDGNNYEIINEIFCAAGIKEKDNNHRCVSSFKIWIVVHPIEDFLSGQRNKQNFEERPFESVNGPTTRTTPIYPYAQEKLLNNTDNDNNELLPLIHLVPTSIFVNNLYGSYPLSTFVPRLYQIMDNSIWNYLIPIVPFIYPDYIETDGNSKENDYIVDGNGIKKGKYRLGESLKRTIVDIYKNYENKLYSLEISQEYADLNARLAGESFLSGGHASGVAPFIFHSERAISRLTEKEFGSHHNLENLNGISIINRIENHHWRILLVDDKSKEELKPKSYGVTKLQIIKRLLEDQFQGLIIETRGYEDQDVISEDKNKKTLLIEYSETIKEAEKALSKKKYDLILLDYLLEKEERQYGYELLENIFKYTEAKEIFESSSSNMIVEALQGHYSSAKFEDFLYYISNNQEAKGSIDNVIKQIIQLDNEIHKEKKEKIKREKEQKRDIYIKKVNDIISDQFKTEDNTDKYLVGPHGRYFFMFISAYTSAVYERLLAEGLNRSEKYWHIAVGACPTNTPKLFLYNLLKLMEKQLEDSGVERLSAKGIFDVVNNIFGKKDKVRSMANESYKDVLNLHYLYRKILKDVEIPKDGIFNTKGSVLITNFIKKNVNLGGLLEHLTQLVHLTAFGTVRQWPEMWEEYIYFKSQFDLEQFKEQYDEKDFYTLCEDIESYILKLKSDIG